MRNHPPGRWRSYDLLAGANPLPRAAGVYVIFIDDEAVYVGSSVNVAVRFYEHKFRYGYGNNIITPWGDLRNDRKVSVRVRRSKRLGDWAMWEIRLIHRLKPRFNQQHLRKRAA